MEDLTIFRQLASAIRSGNVAVARDVLTRCPDLLNQDGNGIYLLRVAASTDNVEMVSLLVEFGADIHAPDGGGDPPAPEGVIDRAASEGAINVVRWLLDHGAKVNFQMKEFPGETRCMPLTGAIHGGHLDVVKLLVEHGGANINALWGSYTPLSYAIMYDQKEIGAYLRSKGALEPSQLAEEKPEDKSNTVLEHIKRHLGKPKKLSLHEIAPGDPPITIHVVPMEDHLALITDGMSARPMTVPEGAEEYQFAELVINLPPDWPFSKKALSDPNNFWPIEWLRRIARYPHENDTWLGGPATVIANGDPPELLAPNTRLTCLLAVTEESEFGSVQLSNEKNVVFYSLYPLYTEERDLELKKGTEHLLRLFQKHDVSPVVDISRPNVARASGRRRRE